MFCEWNSFLINSFISISLSPTASEIRKPTSIRRCKSRLSVLQYHVALGSAGMTDLPGTLPVTDRMARLDLLLANWDGARAIQGAPSDKNFTVDFPSGLVLYDFQQSVLTFLTRTSTATGHGAAGSTPSLQSETHIYDFKLGPERQPSHHWDPFDMDVDELVTDPNQDLVVLLRTA